METKRRSFLTFSPKISRRGDKENIPVPKIPKLKTKRLCLSNSKNKPFCEKQESPSSMRNIYNNVQAKNNSRQSSGKKRSCSKQRKENSCSPKPCSQSRESPKTSDVVVNLSLIENFSPKDKGNGKEIYSALLEQGMKLQKSLEDSLKKTSDKEMCDDDSVIVISETSGSDIRPPFTPGTQWRQNRTCILSSDSEESVRAAVSRKERTVVLETSSSSASDEDVLQSSLQSRAPTTPISKLKAPNSFLSASRYNDIEKWLNKLTPSNGSSDHEVSPTSQTTQEDNPGKHKVKTSDLVETRTKGSVTPDSDIGGTSTENILNKLYGSEWHRDILLTNKPQQARRKMREPATEPCQRQKTALSPSSGSDDSFDTFMQNIRKKFESTRTNWASPDVRQSSFINDDSVEENSLHFYQATSNKLTAGAKNEQLLRKYNVNTLQPKVLFSSSDNSSDSSDKLEGRNNPPKTKVSKKSVAKKAGPKKKSQVIAASQSEQLSFLRSLSASPPAEKCDPRAQLYKKQFKRMRDQLVAELFALYNEKVFDNQFPPDMKIQWNVRMRSTAGFCYNRRIFSPTKGKLRTSRIELSTKVCATPDRVRDTLIHELCHAATWVIDDVKGGHGPHWRAWAMKARKRLPELPPIKRCHEYEVEKKIIYRCTQCGYSFGRQSKSLNLAVKRCGRCLGTFELLVNTKSKNANSGVPRTPRNPTGFALFVKENYRSVKSSQSHLKHQEIMKLLGQQFSQVKIISTADK